MPDLNSNSGRVVFLILTLAVIVAIAAFFALAFDASFLGTLVLAAVGAGVGVAIVLFRTRRA